MKKKQKFKASEALSNLLFLKPKCGRVISLAHSGAARSY